MHSYEAESTISVAAVEQEKIAKMQNLLEDYQNELDKYTGEEVISATPKTVIDTTKVKELEELVSKLSEEKELLELKLEQHILKGSFDPTKNKVLHFM